MVEPNKEIILNNTSECLKKLSRLSRVYPVIDTRFVRIKSDYEDNLYNK